MDLVSYKGTTYQEMHFIYLYLKCILKYRGEFVQIVEVSCGHPLVDRQTPVKTYPSQTSFVGGKNLRSQHVRLVMAYQIQTI